MARALVLNATERPLAVVPARRAVVLVLKEKAEMLASNGVAFRSERLDMPAPSVVRLRCAGYTRLVFDIRGGGLPTMVITRPDDLHVAMTFKNTTTTGVPVSGIRSYQVAAIEPAVQQGSDGTITVDLAQPVRVTAFTLTATGSYAWRLVVDLHSS